MKLKWTVVSMLALSLVVIPSQKARASGVAEGVPAAAAQDRSGWDVPPSGYQEIQRQGFHDGIEGAHKDFDNHRKPDVDNRDEYRHPSVPQNERGAYREGFRRGYQQGVEHLYGNGHHHY